MSSLPPRSLELNYETPPAGGNANTLIKLAAIFNFISAGFDFLHLVWGICLVVLMNYIFSIAPPAPPPPAVPGPPGAPAVAPAPPPPKWVVFLMYGAPGILSMVVSPIKLVAAFKLLRLRKRVWGWSLTAGITGCCQWWMLMGCCVMLIVPIAAGVFTIVVCCLPHAREAMLAGARKAENA
ncbi:MAG TPA: hypothetical protein VHM90_06500 [Phycisphaerae bacterium]|jgi:hypothetical protein|nr:hypothetical protein [Phycisphaerae bacterium]